MRCTACGSMTVWSAATTSTISPPSGTSGRCSWSGATSWPTRRAARTSRRTCSCCVAVGHAESPDTTAPPYFFRWVHRQHRRGPTSTSPCAGMAGWRAPDRDRYRGYASGHVSSSGRNRHGDKRKRGRKNRKSQKSGQQKSAGGSLNGTFCGFLLNF